MKQWNIKAPLVFRLGVVLLCMVAFSSHLMGGFYARYTTSVSGTSTARVAKFDVEASLVENIDGTFTVNVTNNSDVTIECTVGLADGNGFSINGEFTKTVPIGGTGTITFTVIDSYHEKHNGKDLQVVVTAYQID